MWVEELLRVYMYGVFLSSRLFTVHWWCRRCRVVKVMHVRSLRSDIASTTANYSLAASRGGIA